MEYRVVKTTKLSDKGGEIISYHIKKKFLFLWWYFLKGNKSDYIGANLCFNLLYFTIWLVAFTSTSLTFIHYVITAIPMSLLILFLLNKEFKYDYCFKEEAENDVTILIKKKYHLSNEQIVSSIKFKKGNLTIER